MATESKKVTIKIDEGVHGRVIPVGINGIITRIPAGVETEVDPEVLDVLKDSGVRYDEIEKKKGEKSEGPVPEGTPDAMLPRSLNDRTGDQPGDVTSASAPSEPVPEGDNSIASRAEVSDIRVAAERQTKLDAPVAEKAGEGEGGTPKADPLDHDASGKKGGSLPRKAAKK